MEDVKPKKYIWWMFASLTMAILALAAQCLAVKIFAFCVWVLFLVLAGVYYIANK